MAYTFAAAKVLGGSRIAGATTTGLPQDDPESKRRFVVLSPVLQGKHLQGEVISTGF
jgi:hypothetical protein